MSQPFANLKGGDEKGKGRVKEVQRSKQHGRKGVS